MKLWIDDLRSAPEGWEWVKNNTQAIRLIYTCSDSIEEISIDHDICHVSGNPSLATPYACDETFEATARYIAMWIWTLEDHEYEPRFGKSGLPVNIHTANPVGGLKMREIFKEAGLRIKLSTTFGVAPGTVNSQEDL